MPTTRNGTVDGAERTVLGTMLRDPDAVGEVVKVITAESFRTDCHQRVFRAIVELWDAGRPVELTSVADLLQEKGWIDDVGGYSTLAELHEAASVSPSVGHYAAKVRSRALLRGLAQVGREIVRVAESPTGSADEVLGEAEQKILGLASIGASSEARPLADLVGEAFDRIDARSQRGKRSAGLPTGLPSLDDKVIGLQDGESLIVAARPGTGKTAIALSLASNAAVMERVPVLFVSLEQSELELTERLLCCHARVNGHFLRRGTVNQEESRRLMEAGNLLRQAPLFIDDAASQKMLRIAATARRLKVREKLGLVIVDYLQLIEPDNPKAPRQEQVAAISRRLKALARELNIPVVALAQLNRALESRSDRRPRLSDLRESGSIEADADSVWLLHRSEDKPGMVEVIVAKQRNGPTGEVLLRFDPHFMRFADPALEETPLTREEL